MSIKSETALNERDDLKQRLYDAQDVVPMRDERIVRRHVNRVMALLDDMAWRLYVSTETADVVSWIRESSVLATVQRHQGSLSERDHRIVLRWIESEANKVLRA